MTKLIIENMNNLSEISIFLLNKPKDYGEFSKTVIFLNELREEYQIWLLSRCIRTLKFRLNKEESFTIKLKHARSSRKKHENKNNGN